MIGPLLLDRQGIRNADELALVESGCSTAFMRPSELESAALIDSAVPYALFALEPSNSQDAAIASFVYLRAADEQRSSESACLRILRDG